MKIKSKLHNLIISIIISLLLNPSQISACTIFSLSDSTQALMGNPEDYMKEGYMSVVKRNKQFLKKAGNYQLLTNFNPLNPEVGYYPC
jgi:hypothetical protein